MRTWEPKNANCAKNANLRGYGSLAQLCFEDCALLALSTSPTGSTKGRPHGHRARCGIAHGRSEVLLTHACRPEACPRRSLASHASLRSHPLSRVIPGLEGFRRFLSHPACFLPAPHLMGSTRLRSRYHWKRQWEGNRLGCGISPGSRLGRDLACGLMVTHAGRCHLEPWEGPATGSGRHTGLSTASRPVTRDEVLMRRRSGR